MDGRGKKEEMMMACTYLKSLLQFEGFATLKTLIWMCIAVTPHVGTQTLRKIVHLTTVGASEQLTAMALHVRSQGAIVLQPLTALSTLFLFTFCHMRIQVFLQC